MTSRLVEQVGGMGLKQASCGSGRKSAFSTKIVPSTVIAIMVMVLRTGPVRAFTTKPSFYNHVFGTKARSLAFSIVEKRAFVTSTLPGTTPRGFQQTPLRASPLELRRSSRLAATTDTDTVSSATEIDCDGAPYDIINKMKGLGSFEPSDFEKDVYQWWEKSGCFLPDAKQKRQVGEKPYVLPMPPPNVTGRLHMGHAIFVALQDVLARFHRMRGRPVLWLPGTDHASIATQLQVEKRLQAEGLTREELGREEFLVRAWEYKEEQSGHITRQLRSLGASADWSRERFTLDKDLSEAVAEAFVRLYDKGLVYRGEYMVNWAPMLKTAVSDLEVEYSEEEGKLYFFKYTVEDSDGEFHLENLTGPCVMSC